MKLVSIPIYTLASLSLIFSSVASSETITSCLKFYGHGRLKVFQDIKLSEVATGDRIAALKGLVAAGIPYTKIQEMILVESLFDRLTIQLTSDPYTPEGSLSSISNSKKGDKLVRSNEVLSGPFRPRSAITESLLSKRMKLLADAQLNSMKNALKIEDQNRELDLEAIRNAGPEIKELIETIKNSGGELSPEMLVILASLEHTTTVAKILRDSEARRQVREDMIYGVQGGNLLVRQVGRQVKSLLAKVLITATNALPSLDNVQSKPGDYLSERLKQISNVYKFLNTPEGVSYRQKIEASVRAEVESILLYVKAEQNSRKSDRTVVEPVRLQARSIENSISKMSDSQIVNFAEQLNDKEMVDATIRALVFDSSVTMLPVMSAERD